MFQIFGSLGLSSNTTSLLATGVVGVAMLLATIPSILYIDRIGRRPALALGALGMGACHFIIAVIFAKNEHQWPTHHAAGWAAIVMGRSCKACSITHLTSSSLALRDPLWLVLGSLVSLREGLGGAVESY